MFFGIGTAISIRLLTREEVYFADEFSFSLVIAVLCHCNVHPAVLFLVVSYHVLCMSVDDLTHNGQSFVTSMSVMAFDCAMLVAVTWDFTLRVKAGMWPK